MIRLINLLMVVVDDVFKLERLTAVRMEIAVDKGPGIELRIITGQFLAGSDIACRDGPKSRLLELRTPGFLRTPGVSVGPGPSRRVADETLS